MLTTLWNLPKGRLMLYVKTQKHRARKIRYFRTFNGCLLGFALLLILQFSALLISDPLHTIDASKSLQKYENLKKAADVRKLEELVPPNVLDISMSLDENKLSSMPCYEGEILYMKRYPDINEAFNNQLISSGFQHWSNSGRHEGRDYVCNKERSANSNPSSVCPEGETLYLKWYKDVREAVPKKFKTGFAHWELHGKEQGMVYFCKLT